MQVQRTSIKHVLQNVGGAVTARYNVGGAEAKYKVHCSVTTSLGRCGRRLRPHTPRDFRCHAHLFMNIIIAVPFFPVDPRKVAETMAEQRRVPVLHYHSHGSGQDHAFPMMSP